MTTNSQLLAQQPILRRNSVRRGIRYAVIVAEAAIVWRFSVVGLWPLAFAAVIAVELWGQFKALRLGSVVTVVPELVAGFAASWMITLYPRAFSQLAIAIAYLGWRLWLEQAAEPLATRHLVRSLVSQAIIFEAVFLAAAIWDVPKIFLLVLVWLGTYASTYQLLRLRQDRAAGVLAAAWALIATEITFVTLAWLVSYTVLGGYFIIPQPAIILTVLAYSFGSIYLAQRQNQLGRRRLTEYLIIGLVIILIVIAGTTWKGSL